jgi:PIN domain nuclease of toxin-antitoxin system
VRLLLDTHAFLWWLVDVDRLSSTARQALDNTNNIVHVSAASIWEASIKVARGRLGVGTDDLPAAISATGFVELPVTAAHGWHAGALPAHHSDPFDRLLVAQAQLEQLVLVTSDTALGAYGVQTLAC